MSEYGDIYFAHLKKLSELRQKEEEIRTERAKVADMAKASFALMSDEEQAHFNEVMAGITEYFRNKELGLTDAIRKVLEASPNEWFGATRVRDKLKQECFDFSSYASNPLASIHTVLKRFKRNEVKARNDKSGNREYRWARVSGSGVFEKARRRIAEMGKLSDMK